MSTDMALLCRSALEDLDLRLCGCAVGEDQRVAVPVVLPAQRSPRLDSRPDLLKILAARGTEAVKFSLVAADTSAEADMRAHAWSLLFVAALLTAALLALGATLAFGRTSSPSSGERARATTQQFFFAINRRRFREACDMLSARFYRAHHVPDRAHCVRGFTLGMSREKVRFEITRVAAAKGRATVEALANGAPGRVVLVEERGHYKVLAVEAG